MNILIRTNSSSYIGTGHIMRDLVLAKKYETAKITFATQDLEGNINHKIIEAGYNIEFLNSNDFEELDRLIKNLNINMIIIDSYDIRYKFEKRLKDSNPNLKIFVLDDIYEKHYCDILLNHNIYADEKKYKNKVPKHCKLRCGAKYTLLRDEFLEAKKAKNRVKKKNKTIFLAMGGADHKNLNIKILKILNEYKNIKVDVVTTFANKNLEKLKKYVKNRDFVKLHIDSNKIAKLMIKSDLAIITPSVTANEIFYLKIPMIVIKTAKNQKYMYEYLIKNSYNSLKKFDTLKFENIIKGVLYE